MRKRGRWMTSVDETVLEYLAEHEAGTPSEMHDNAGIQYSSQYVAERCRELADREFIQRISAAPTYRIAERGEKFLAGEYDARELDDQDVPEGNAGPTATAD